MFASNVKDADVDFNGNPVIDKASLSEDERFAQSAICGDPMHLLRPSYMATQR